MDYAAFAIIGVGVILMLLMIYGVEKLSEEQALTLTNQWGQVFYYHI